jgi:hypothetical protein
MTSIVLISIFGMMQMQTIQASNGAFDQGYRDGKDDYLNGESNHAYCDPYNSDPNPDAFCAAYKLGYQAGWLAAGNLYGDQ